MIFSENRFTLFRIML